jgi:hypothetical protein
MLVLHGSVESDTSPADGADGECLSVPWAHVRSGDQDLIAHRPINGVFHGQGRVTHVGGRCQARPLVARAHAVKVKATVHSCEKKYPLKASIDLMLLKS